MYVHVHVYRLQWVRFRSLQYESAVGNLPRWLRWLYTHREFLFCRRYVSVCLCHLLLVSEQNFLSLGCKTGLLVSSLEVIVGGRLSLSCNVWCIMLADNGELSLQMPRFVRNTSQLWHRPNISREEGIFLHSVIFSFILIC